MNQTRLDILKNSLFATLGLCVFAVGIYFVIQANIGVAPWDVFCIGLAKTLGILYGNSSIIISVTIICIDLILKEKIGLGTILDAIVVGKFVDLLNWLDLIGTEHSLVVSILMIIIGVLIECVGQFMYMKAALSCGPRDALQVGCSRRLPKLSIGTVNIIILLIVLVIGYFLHGPIGIGTVMVPFCIGFSQDFVFKLFKFDPKAVEHQGLLGSINVIVGKKQ